MVSLSKKICQSFVLVPALRRGASSLPPCTLWTRLRFSELRLIRPTTNKKDKSKMEIQMKRKKKKEKERKGCNFVSKTLQRIFVF